MTTDQVKEIQAALALLIERGEVVELRVPGTSRGTCSGYFDDSQLLGDAAVDLSGQGPGVYFTINPVNPTLLARANNRVRRYVKQGECTADTDILRRRFFPIDFDAARPAGISSTDEEHAAAISRATKCREWLVERGWPAPILADSGNGGHLLFRVDLPNDDASTKLLKESLKILGGEFDDDHVTVDPSTFNASRVWKLYATQVCKGDSMPDRPHRVANIIEAPDRLEIVPAELLAELAIALRPKSKEADSGKLASFSGGDYSSLDVVRWFQAQGRHGRDLGGGKHAVLCPWVNEHSDQRPAEHSDTIVWEAADGRWPVFHCSHAHCKDRSLQDVTNLWGDANRFCSGGFQPDKNRSQAEDDTGSNGHDRPTISITNRHMRDITSDAVRALKAADETEPVVFSRGNSVVRIRTGDEGVSAEAMTNASLRGALDRVADFVSSTKKGDIPARPPPDVTADILSLPALPFRGLRGFSETPTFLPDGTLLSHAGYDSESGLYLRLAHLEGIRSDIPINEALSLLRDELLGEFPFADDGSKAHAMVLLLQLFVRHMIHGPTPLFLIDAPARGTGKGLFADVASWVSLGRSAAVMALTENDDELEKRVTAMMVEGSPIVLLDNVTSLKSATLSAVLTTTFWRGRWLGKSKMVEAPNNATWVATGNNVALSDEMLRRTVHIRLDAGVERPEERTGFRHGDLMAWAEGNRASLVSACVSLVQAWIDAGMPSGSGTLGRYERWVEVMGGILDVAGVEGLLTNREALYDNADADALEWTLLCKAWWERQAEKPLTAGDLFKIAKDNGLAMDVWAGRSALSGQQRFGHALRARRDRVFGGFYIRNAGNDGQTKSLAYRLERGGHKTPEIPETPGPTPDSAKDETGVSASKPDETPTPKGTNPPRATGTNKEVYGVSGVPSGPPADDENQGSVSADGFSGNTTRLEPPGSGEPSRWRQDYPPVHYVTDTEHAGRVVAELMAEPVIGLDIETTGLDPLLDQIRLVQLACPTATYVVDVYHVPVDVLTPVLSSGPVKVIHNAKFDAGFLYEAPGGAMLEPLHDTMLADQVVYGRSHDRSLKEIVKEYLGDSLDKDEQVSDWGAEQLTEKQIEYAASDAAVLLPLKEKLDERLDSLGLSGIVELENRAVLAMVWMERSGVGFDEEIWGALATEAQELLDTHRERLDALVGEPLLEAEGLLADTTRKVNWNSAAQVLRLLNDLGLDAEDTKQETLEILQEEHPVVSALLDYREASKKASTYGNKWAENVHPVTGRVHADWKQIGASTGRMSCAKPNLQNLPRDPRYRACFTPAEGRVFIKADYAQIELRIVAEMAPDARMKRAFMEGKDLHATTATLLRGKEETGDATPDERQLAKAVNFGLVYGMGAKALAKYARTNFGQDLDESEAAGIRRRYFEAYPDIRIWQQIQGRKTETRTVLGRRRILDGDRPYTVRLNSPIQGTGADGLKLALAMMWESRGDVGAFPVLAIHDEIIVEAPAEKAREAKAWLVRCMKEAMEEYLKEVPVVVEAEIKSTWAQE